MTRVGVIGACGRMGRMVCRAVADDPDLTLVAAVDRSHVGEPIGSLIGVPKLEIRVSDELHEVLTADAEVAVDFTHIDAARENLLYLAENGIHAVVGTTGFSDEDYTEVEALFTKSNCLIAPNFAIGAVLMMRFAAECAKLFDSAEIIEYHHDQKVDRHHEPVVLRDVTAKSAKDHGAPQTQRSSGAIVTWLEQDRNGCLTNLRHLPFDWSVSWPPIHSRM